MEALVVMLGKLWQIVILVILACYAAQLVLAVIGPMVPTLIGLAIGITLIGTLVSHKRRW